MKLFKAFKSKKESHKLYVFNVKDDKGVVFTTEILALNLNEAHNEFLFDFSSCKEYEILWVEEIII